MAFPTSRFQLAGATPSEITGLLAAHAALPETQQAVTERQYASVDTAGLTNILNVRRNAGQATSLTEAEPGVEKALASVLHISALEDLTMATLLARAEAHELEVPRGIKKPDLVALLAEHEATLEGKPDGSDDRIEDLAGDDAFDADLED